MRVFQQIIDKQLAIVLDAEGVEGVAWEDMHDQFLRWSRVRLALRRMQLTHQGETVHGPFSPPPPKGRHG